MNRSEHGHTSEDDRFRRLDPKLRQAARWAQRHAGRSPDALPAVEAEAVSKTQWAGVAGAVEQYAIAASGIPGASSALGILAALYGVEDAQAAMLGTIDRNVRLLREGPFRSGRLLLQEAARVGPEHSEYAGFLRTARERFYDARGLAASVQERALVEFHLGSVYALEGRRADAEYWLGQSFESARTVAAELAAQADNVKVLHSRRTTAALSYFYPAGLFVVPAKLKRVWNAERAAAALQAFLPFVDCIVRSYNTVSERRRLAPIDVTVDADGTTSVYLDAPPDAPADA